MVGRTLDKQVQGDSFDVDRYPRTTGKGAGVAVFRLSHKEPIQTYSEMVNAARTIPEMIDVFPLGNMRAIVARTAPEKLEMRGLKPNLQPQALRAARASSSALKIVIVVVISCTGIFRRRDNIRDCIELVLKVLIFLLELKSKASSTATRRKTIG